MHIQIYNRVYKVCILVRGGLPFHSKMTILVNWFHTPLYTAVEF